MKHPPLKRHPALQPFSRDHYAGLVQAQRLIKAADGDAAARREALSGFLAAWQSEIAEHFADEEQLLPDLMDSEQLDRLRHDHERLRSHADQGNDRGAEDDPGAEWCREVGSTLNDHIRWEERSLFPAIEKTASNESLEQLEARTRELEARRPRSSCSVNQETNED